MSNVELSLESGERAVTAASSVAKRVLDVVVAAVALVVVAPFMALISLLIIATSRGPVTFRQKRIGLNGEQFNIVKYRSMVADAEERLETDPSLRALYLTHDHKIPAHLDTRLTRIGRVLRATSLDELPQLWNVLMGHMSLVGPRPVVPSELERYGDRAWTYTSVRPGLTGPWQSSGRSTVSYDERIEMDADYVANWSMKRDLVIMLKTVPAVLKRHGAH